MALIFPWATKEYLLWEMSLGQIVMYHNLAIEIKSGKSATDENALDGKPKSLTDYSYDELKEKREELRNLGLIAKPDKKQLAAKYGDI